MGRKTIASLITDNALEHAFSDALHPRLLFKSEKGSDQPMSIDELIASGDWSMAKYRIKQEEEAKVFRSNNTGLPFRTIGIDTVPEDGETVWVYEDEYWDGGAGIGWHRTSLYCGENGWWNEPVCGRCWGSCWLPGDTLKSELPDESTLTAGVVQLNEMWAEVRKCTDARISRYQEEP